MNVLDAIRRRRSVRAYANTPIPPDVLDRCKQALRFAPSACNYQPWRFIFVTDLERRRALAELAGDQLWIAEAPVLVVACGLPEKAYTGIGGHGNSAEIDVAIALDHLSLVAVSEGLGTCWIGAFDERKAKRFLDVPEEARIVMLMPLGYPASPESISTVTDDQRKPEADIFRTNGWKG